ncbi:CobW family GTP-binding protein [Thalassococcus lentus]|uniref:GTP-binding protein n=1 Tax=Thalassococcus lentus TaxID=1210524 RepID=A0ABT4XPP4_9RHOB|nr:GTP-binding protein [Thalassococcus lentus]MDA7423914.1 GTP-binding protein [Thalassococcus lentus]
MRLPLTVIGGYLGAGKTTVLNRLLSETHGQRLMIMVNDFGAVNIDAALLESRTDDTIALTNGCVCCTMGADLFMAIGDVLDRPARPDHLLIEASGIGDPAAIANAALTEPDLAYGGIATVIDGLTWDALSQDAKIGAQIRGQAEAAQLLLISKSATTPAFLPDRTTQNLATQVPLAPLLLDQRPVSTPSRKTIPHPAYTNWSGCPARSMTAPDLRAVLNARPDNLFRLKGWVDAPSGKSWEVHCVGSQTDIKPAKRTKAHLIGIGLAEQSDPSVWQSWLTASLC